MGERVGGQMPEICGSCRAFLVQGRPDCPFCGALASAGRATPDRPASFVVAPPAPEPPAEGSGTWLPPAPSALTEPAGQHGLDVGWLMKTGGVIAVLAVLGGLFFFVGDRDPEDGPRASPTKADQLAGPLDQLVGVCGGPPSPIEGAAPFEPTPGRHRVEAVVIPPAEGELDPAPWRLRLDDERWQSPERDNDLRLEEVELVACYVVSGARWADDCEFETVWDGDPFTIPLWTTWGRVVIREAATGEEVLRKDVAAPAPECPDEASTGDDRTVQHPEADVLNLLRLFNDGTG